MPYFRSRLHYSIGNIQSQLPIKGQLLGLSFLTSWKEALRCLPSPLSTHVIGVRLTSNLSLLITIYSHFLFTFEFFAYQLNKIVCASAYTMLWILMPNFRADGATIPTYFSFKHNWCAVAHCTPFRPSAVVNWRDGAKSFSNAPSPADWYVKSVNVWWCKNGLHKTNRGHKTSQGE